MAASFHNKRRPRKLDGAKKLRKVTRRCETEECNNLALASRRYCCTCRSRKYTDPLKRMWYNLRSSAKKRQIEFGLSWEFFKEFAVRTGYNLLSGRGGNDLHVDRIDVRRGYLEDNVQALTASENCRKRWQEYPRGGHPF